MNEQMDLFSFSMPEFHIGDKHIRLIELFAGIGSQAAALRNLGVPFTHYKVVEWDRFAMASYNAIHGTNFEPSDIQKIHAEDLEIRERERYCYIMTYSFPCQDISGAGKMAGFTKGSGTRSGLLWEVERILDECDELPQVLLMENVPLIVSKKNLPDFQLWERKLEQLGYTNHVALLNGKEIGYPHPIPQNRNRCFMVSILGQYHYTFPKKQKLTFRLKDMLEDKVDEKYYLSDKAIRYITKPQRMEKKYTQINGDIGIPCTAKGQSNWTGDFVQEEGHIEKGTGKHQSNITYSMEGLCPTIPAATGVKEPPKMFIERERERVRRSAPGEEEALTDIAGTSSLRSSPVGYIEKGTGKHQSNEVYSKEGIARCLQATDFKGSIKIVEQDSND